MLPIFYWFIYFDHIHDKVNFYMEYFIDDVAPFMIIFIIRNFSCMNNIVVYEMPASNWKVDGPFLHDSIIVWF